MFEALKTFQSDHGLQPDGRITPDGEVFKLLSAQTSDDQLDGKYRWMSVLDDRVRASHAARHGEIFDFGAHPYPGEEHNCRCWAEPVKPEKNICIELWNNIQNLRARLQEINNQILQMDRQIQSKRNEIQEQMKKIIDIIDFPIPGLDKMTLDDIFKALEKFLGRIDALFKIKQISDHFIKKQGLEKKLEDLEKKRKSLQDQADALQKKLEDTEEEFSIRCPNVFAGA